MTSWRDVPAAAWTYRVSSYQVVKIWLPYLERDILPRALRAEEVRHFADAVRQIGAMLLRTTHTELS